MISSGPFQEVEVECAPEIVGAVIGKLTEFRSWVRDSRIEGNRCFVVADVPEEAVDAFSTWLRELDPAEVLGSAAKREDV